MLSLGVNCALDSEETRFPLCGDTSAQLDASRSVVKLNSAGEFVLGETPLVPNGINSYFLLQYVGFGRTDEVIAVMHKAKELGRPVIRTNGFFEGVEGSTNPAILRDETGELREEGFQKLDQLLDIAARQGVRLILVLSNHWDDFGGARAVLAQALRATESPHDVVNAWAEIIPQEQWPSEGSYPRELFYWHEPVIGAQIAYVSYLINRENSINGRAYRNDPTIFAWEITNEARCEVAACNADSGMANPLPSWAKRMSEVVRRAGASQLIAWGGAGYQGEHGEDMRVIAETAPEIDILTLHQYPLVLDAPDLTSEEALEKANTAGLEVARGIRSLANLVDDLGSRGSLLEELGWKSIGMQAQTQTDVQRSIVFARAAEAAASERIAILPWMIGEPGRSTDQEYLITEQDPQTLKVLTCSDLEL